ncbi:hypothetical protein ACIQVR_40780 [Streptomyces xanthochromogenes]|uniref:hypothetical protein n=1 Tax=Streptomyces xanthochromogenes TaxID=67384 RepID=UPI00381A959E
MTTSRQAVVAGLSDALFQQAQAAGSASPTVRGADWRLAVVATVNSDGTIVTTDGITVRRSDMYVTPVVGDTIAVTISSAGNWLAWCRTAPATTAGTWQNLTFSGTWSAWGSPYFTPAYRINGDGTVSLCGLAKAPASTTGASTITNLPAAARPAFKARFVTEVNTNVYGVIDVFPSGDVQINDYTGTASWAALDAARFRLT